MKDTSNRSGQPARTRSWVASYWSVDGRCLLGAVLRSRTSRYGRREDAEARLEGLIEINGGPSRCAGEIIPDERAPEIFLHCGPVLTGIGCYCPGCRKLLTRADAEASS